MQTVETESLPRSIFSKCKQHATEIVSFFLFVIGIFTVYKLLSTIDFHLVVHELKQIPQSTLALAVASTLLGYIALTGYDWSALRYLNKTIPTSVLMLGSFTAYALSNTVGLAVLSGGAVRHRFYRGLGLDAADIAIIASFCAMSFGLGVSIIGLTALAYQPEAVSFIFTASVTTIRFIALTLVALIVGLAFWGATSQKNVKLGRFSLSFPRPKLLLIQLLVAMLDITLAGFTLYILLPSNITMPFSAFLAVFSIAVVVGVLSHVPGGIGVFESIIIGSLATSTDLIPGVTAAVLAYRVIYYFFPFVLSIVLLTAANPLLRASSKVRNSKNYDTILAVFEFINPSLITGLSALIFISGAALLLNGIVPIPKSVLNEIAPLIHAGTFDVSNIILGAVGAALTILSNGLRRRIKGAFWIVFMLMLVGSGALIVQGIDYDLLLFMVLGLVLLYLSKDQFYRSSKLTTGIMSMEWLLLCGSLALSALLLLFFAHENTAYQNQQWWQFALNDNLSRALRIYGAGLVVGLLVLLVMALRPARSAPIRAAEFDTELVQSIIAKQDNPEAGFVFTGDKHVLLSENKDAFIMYAPQGRSLVALGEPIGNPIAHDSLIDAFIDLGDKHNYRPCFYKVGAELLASYIDFGFSMSKLGEEAVIPLGAFSLDGPARKKLRTSYNRAQRDGLTFEYVQPPYSDALFAELSVISNEWLESKHSQEKSFSLGRFNEEYLQRSPLALVKHEGIVVAFANILVTDTHKGCALDLMRHIQNTPSGCMEFLFTSLILQLKTEGFTEFSMGMVPLTGLSQSRNKRLWDHIGIAVARFGGHFYNFAGLRTFKNKFDPEWRPHYIATWGGVDPLLVAADVNALVSGGIIGALSRPS